jgi:hypothetical protein
VTLGIRTAAPLAVIALLVGFASVAANPRTDPSFVGVTPMGVGFIQWTESRSGELTGQMQIAFVTTASRGLLADLLSSLGVTVPESDRLRVQTLNLPFTGIRNRQSVSITMTFSQLFATKTMTLTGTLRGNTLTLTAPGSNGLLDTLVMPAGTAEDYNRAVVAIQKQVAHLNDLAAQREAVIQAARAFVSAHSRLTDDLARLDHAKDFARVLESYRETWVKMQGDNDKLRTDASKRPFTCFERGTVQFDLGTLQFDKGSVEFHNGTFESIRRSALDAVDAVGGDVASLQSALQELQRSVQADTTKVLSQRDVDQAKEQSQRDQRAADEQVRRVLTALQETENQVKVYNEDSIRLLNEATEFVASLSCSD